MKIAGIPKEFKTFFNRFRDLFSKRQFFYFSVYIYGITVSPKDKKNVSQIASAWVDPICRSSLQRFLSEVRWEFDKVMMRARRQVISRIFQQSKKKRHLELVIDDTDIDKFGSQIFGVGWYRRSENERPWRAIQVVVLGAFFEDWFVPIDFWIYVKKQDCKYIKMKFVDKLTMAKDMLSKLSIPRDTSVDVMFDSWYLNEKVTSFIEDKKWHWFSRARCNRNVEWEKPKEGEKKKIKLSKYSSGIAWEPLLYQTKRKSRALVGHQRIGYLNSLGRVKIVISSLEYDGSARIAYFVSNQTQIQMVELIKKFERRWKIEVYFRESRAYLALEHWFFRDVASVVHHLCLSLVAMISCFCVRLEERKPNESLGTLGEFVRSLQQKNQRVILQKVLEEWNLEKMMGEDLIRFKELCESIGL